MVESTVRDKLQQAILFVGQLKCQQLFGMVPDDLTFDYRPLRVLSSEQEENVKTAKFNRVIQALNAWLCTAKDAIDAINRESLLPVKVTDVAQLTQLYDEKREMALAGQTGEEEDEDDADEEDAQE